MKTSGLISLILLLSSCTNYYFSEPQPSDSENITVIPKKLRGSWVMSVNDPDSYDSITIGENFFIRAEGGVMKELKSKADKDTTVFFIDDRVYLKEDGSLEGGFPYHVEGDSIIVEYVSRNLIKLGPDAFLRKLDYGYLFNQEKEDLLGWWNIRFVDTRNKEFLLIMDLEKEDIHKLPDFEVLSEDFSSYIKDSRTRDQWQEFIDQGGFSERRLKLRYDERIK